MRKTLLIILGIIVISAVGLSFYIYAAPKLSKENRQIDQWITDNDLNQYGDLQNTVYSNGKPCDNTLDCYEYIKTKNPDKPWEK